MLRRAFEVLGRNRVQFKVDARNTRSHPAMLKLGATLEGTLRHDQIRPDGSAHDRMMFSILRHEWPEVREKLERRVQEERPTVLLR